MKESKRTHTNKKSSNKTARPAHMRRSSAVSGSSRSTARRKRVLRRNLGIGITCGILLCLLVFMGKTVLQRASERDERELQELVQEENGPLLWQKQGAPYIDVQLLTPNEYSRPQIPMESVQYIATIIRQTQAQEPWPTGIILRIYQRPERQRSAAILWWDWKEKWCSVFPRRKFPMRPMSGMWIPFPLKIATQMRQVLLMMPHMTLQ